MGDIVEELRHRLKWDLIAFSSFDPDMCSEAADEIERLRDDIVRYRVLINELADAEQGDSEQTWSDALTALYQAVGR